MEIFGFNMRKTYITTYVIFIFLFFFYITYENFNRPRIYVISSYSSNFSWVRDIEKGINRVFKKHPRYFVKNFYLNTKENPSEKFLKKTSKTAIKLINSWQPEILILTDDNAQKIIGKHFMNHKKIKILFSGVDAPYQIYGYDKANNVSGLKQVLPLKSFKEMCLKITPKRGNRLIVIGDDSYTMKMEIDSIKKFDWSPLEVVDIIQCKTFDDWKKAILDAPNKADYIVNAVFHTIKDTKSNIVINPDIILKWTDKNAKIPFLNTLIQGGIVSIGNSPFEQGEIPALMAEKIIEKHEKISNMPVEFSKYSMIYLRPHLMRKFNLNIPNIYFSFADATNTVEKIKEKK